MTALLGILLSHWRTHRLQLAITVAGIALGVAVVTAMDIANVSALSSFKQSVEKVGGKATHQVVAADGLSGVGEELFAPIARIPKLHAAPVIETHGLLLTQAGQTFATTPEEERNRADSPMLVRILGVDPFSEEPFRPASNIKSEGTQSVGRFEDWIVRDDGCVLPATLATKRKLKIGDAFELAVSGRRHTLRVIGTYAMEDNSTAADDLLFMDIAAVQERFGLLGKLDSIDLILPRGSDGDACAAEIRKLLPAGLALQRPSERAGRTEALLSAFQLNLSALSLLALVVGVFLVYNTLTVAVLQRRPLIGTLRCLGSESRDVRNAILLEAAALGAIGSILGLVAGTILAGVFLERVGGTMNDLYTHVGALSVFYDETALLKGFALGVLASLAGAFVPAREAGAVTPVSVLRRSSVERGAQRAWKWLTLAGLFSIAVAAVLALWPGSSAVPGLAAAFALSLGGALMSPGITRGLSTLSALVLGRFAGMPGLLAARGIGNNLSRTGLAVGALALALSMTIGVALMVSSFRRTLDNWMEQSLHADVYLRPAGPSLLRHKTFLTDDTLAALHAIPDVATVDTYRGREVFLPSGAQVIVAATNTAVTFSRNRERFPLMAGDAKTAMDRMIAGDAMISESLSRKANLNLGDTFEIPTPTGSATLRIAGIYYEYATDRGVVSLDAARYAEVFGDGRANSASLYLKDGASPEKVRDQIRDTLGAEKGLYVFSNRSLREEAFRVFDKTFAITRQLESLSLTVGVCGILAALLALLRERSAEFALLRAIGMSAAELARIVVAEGVLMGAFAFAVACVLGPALSMLLIHVINVRAFGWTIFFAADPVVFARVGALSLLMAGLAGVFPAIQARRMNLASALREE